METPFQIIRNRKNGWPQERVVADFENAVIRAGVAPVGTEKPSWLLDSSGRLLSRSGVLRPLGPATGIRLVGLMGRAESQLVPHGLRSTLCLYIWECWPDTDGRWASFFGRWKPLFVFFTSSEAQRHWAPRLPNALTSWAPEAIEPRRYPPGPDLCDRGTTVLELGRRHDAFHRSASEYLAKQGADHLYARPVNRSYFPITANSSQGYTIPWRWRASLAL